MATVPLTEGTYVDDSRYELLLNGQFRPRPMPDEDHADVIHYLVRVLEPFADARAAKVLAEWSLSDGEHRLTPDIMFAGEGYRPTRRGHLWAPPPPFLVIEVRSVDQPIRELFDKTEDYRAYDVPHYWIVDPLERSCYDAFTRGASELSIRPENTHLTAGDIQIEIAPIWNCLTA
jgi:Uma2 family endonuclease